jgi:hypothetical protein
MSGTQNSDGTAKGRKPPHLEHVLRVYRRHYNVHRRPSHATAAAARRPQPTPLSTNDCRRRRDFVGGLIHEYEAA